jgi:hypothetical protein
MNKVDELKINKTMLENNAKLLRLYASLKVRLGFKITKLGPSNVLHHRNEVLAVKDFLQKFSKAAKACNSKESTVAELEEALKDCNLLCEFKVDVPQIFENASKLLLCIDDKDPWLTEQRNPCGIVVLPPLSGQDTGQLTANILQLLTMKVSDDDDHPYNKGRDLFFKYLRDSDMFANTPLEISYYWALSVRAEREKVIRFIPGESETTFHKECKALKPGRLFPGTNSSEYDLKFLVNEDAKTTIFYVDEAHDGLGTHPLADMFFVSDDNKLVLVDIAGSGNYENIHSKLAKLNDWISNHSTSICDGQNKLVSIRGVVLAPNFNKKKSKVFKNGTMLVCGDNAIRLLGGLRQIRRWME